MRLTSALLVAALSAPIHANEPNIHILEPECRPDLTQSVVELKVAEIDEWGIITSIVGTTFVIGEDLWVTADHNIQDEVLLVEARVSGGDHRALTVVESIPDYDLLILRGDTTGLVPLALGAGTPDITELLYAVGVPGHAGGVLASYIGFIVGTTPDKVVTSTFVTHGMSGGPVVWCDGDGDLLVYGMIHGFYKLIESRPATLPTGSTTVQFQRNRGESAVVPRLDQILEAHGVDWLK